MKTLEERAKTIASSYCEYPHNPMDKCGLYEEILNQLGEVQKEAHSLGFIDAQLQTPEVYGQKENKMTPKERAEKMVQAMLLGIGENKSYFEYFLHQIEEAQREAFKQGQETRWFLKAIEKQSYSEGFNAAREIAKGILCHETIHPKNTCDRCDFAQRIAEMKPEEK